MKNLSAIIFISLLLNTYQTYAQAHAQLDINNINARISVTGNHFWDLQGYPCFEVPSGSQKHTMFASTLWIGGFDLNNTLFLSAERYRQNGQDYTTGPLALGTAATNASTISQWNMIWILKKTDIDLFKLCYNNPSACPGYVVPASITGWPAHGDTTLGQNFYLAPFADVNADGVYNPQDGDYPLIRGDKALFFIFNDTGIPNTESGGIPLGIEVHGMAYAFNCPIGDAFKNTIFMHYKVHNRSTKTYYNTHIGLFTDFDIGYGYDDFIACDVKRGSILGYNGTSIDGTGGTGHYGALPPAQSLTFLAGPYMNPDGLDNPKTDSLGNQLCNESINGFQFGDGTSDNERLGLNRFMFLSNIGSNLPAMQDPSSASEYFKILSGFWKDNAALQYGGNGHPNATPPSYGPACRFAYPGSSDSCLWGTAGTPPNGPLLWTEETANNSPHDRRGVAISGPFTFTAGSVHELDYAFVYGRTDTASITSVEVMKANIDAVRSAFFNNITPCGTPIVVSGLATATVQEAYSANIYPNPAQHSFTIELNNVGREMLRIEIYDSMGRKVLYRTAAAPSSASGIITMDINSLSSGLYHVRISAGNKIMTKKLMVSGMR